MTMHEDLKAVAVLKRHGDIDGAELLLSKYLFDSSTREDRWQSLCVLYTFALVEGHLDRAGRYARQLVEADPNDAFAHDCLGRVLRMIGDVAGAEKEARSALDLAMRENDPSRFAYATDLAEVLMLQGKFDECRRVAQADWKPEDESGGLVSPSARVSRLVLLGRVSRELGQCCEAVGFYRLATRTAVSMRTPVTGLNTLFEELARSLQECKANHDL